jgi:4'-phosphopantetheinyl transferase EntD
LDDPSFALVTPHGLLVGVRAPVEPDASCLFDEERALSAGLTGARLRTFLGGRLALRRALERAGLRPGPILRDDRGAPRLPDGVRGSASISHKDDVAVALFAPEEEGLDVRARVGVDVEIDRPFRVDIARRVLRDGELALADGLDPLARGRFVLRRFSAKEAVYKAIDPFVRRYVGFREVSLDAAPGAALGDDRAGAEVELSLEPASPVPLRVDARQIELVLGDATRLVISTARAAPTSGSAEVGGRR